MKTYPKYPTHPRDTRSLFGSLLIAIIMLVIVMACTSCGVVASAITGQEIPSTAVQRAGHDEAPVILISSADLAIAEQAAPGTVHGLYDAGYIANRAREVVIEATK